SLLRQHSFFEPRERFAERTRPGSHHQIERAIASVVPEIPDTRSVDFQVWRSFFQRLAGRRVPPSGNRFITVVAALAPLASVEAQVRNPRPQILQRQSVDLGARALIKPVECFPGLRIDALLALLLLHLAGHIADRENPFAVVSRQWRELAQRRV